MDEKRILCKTTLICKILSVVALPHGEALHSGAFKPVENNILNVGLEDMKFKEATLLGDLVNFEISQKR